MDADTISLTEAAQTLRLSWSQAWRLVLKGELDGQKVGKEWRVTKASVTQRSGAK